MGWKGGVPRGEIDARDGRENLMGPSERLWRDKGVRLGNVVV